MDDETQTKTFQDLGLGDATLRAVTESGYTTPTPIQAAAIPLVLQGRDLIGIAQTGTGKTAGFTLPMIDILAAGRARARMPRALVLEPTRELAAQVADNFDKYAAYAGLSRALLIGGESMGPQQRELQKGPDVLIATPGRLMDHFERGAILLNNLKIVVVDEADRMLDMGFIPDIEKIMKMLPPLRQTLMFSATMPDEIKRLTDKFLQFPRQVSVAPPSSAAESVDQTLVRLPGKNDKRKALKYYLTHEHVDQAFVFCNRKKDVGELAKFLEKEGFSVAPLHGDMPQSSRTQTLAAFKDGSIKVLVCSDVAARGLDIADVGHVFNYDIPMNAEDYIHRIGRTGRAEASGKAITFYTEEDEKFWQGVQKLIGRSLPETSWGGGSEKQRDKTGETPERDRQDTGRGKSRKAASAKAPADKAGPEKSSGAQAETGDKKQRAPEASETELAEKPGFGDHVPEFIKKQA